MEWGWGGHFKDTLHLKFVFITLYLPENFLWDSEHGVTKFNTSHVRLTFHSGVLKGFSGV